jgi:hypothetical protein
MGYCSGDEYHSKMPPTREPSPEPFSETAKRYGLREDAFFLQQLQQSQGRDVLHKEETFFIGHEQIPLAHSSSHLQSSPAQCHPTYSGYPLNYLTQFNSTTTQRSSTKDDSIYKYMDMENVPAATVSKQAFDEMQRASRKLKRATTWLRVVHRGYGQVAWRDELQRLNIQIVQGPFASEGDYVIIPEGLGAHELVDMLVEVNRKVRKLIWFPEMKRANKSRVLFKWEPIRVDPTAYDKPMLVETKAFAPKD